MAITDAPLTPTKAKHPTIDWTGYNDLINGQKTIGWKQIQYRRFTLRWHKQQQVYEEGTLRKTAQGAPKWLRQLISTIWQFAHRCWL
eukprot:4624123-Ditylum_brightwellii.AAC.1